MHSNCYLLETEVKNTNNKKAAEVFVQKINEMQQDDLWHFKVDTELAKSDNGSVKDRLCINCSRYFQLDGILL